MADLNRYFTLTKAPPAIHLDSRVLGDRLLTRDPTRYDKNWRAMLEDGCPNTLVMLRPNRDDLNPADIICVETPTRLVEGSHDSAYVALRALSMTPPDPYLNVTLQDVQPLKNDVWRNGLNLYWERFGHLPQPKRKEALEKVFDALTLHFLDGKLMSEFSLEGISLN